MLKIILVFFALLVSFAGYCGIGDKSVQYGITIPANTKKQSIQESFPAEKYATIDAHVKTADKYDKRLSELVDYLIKPYRNNEELKARAIFSWIVYNLNYDSFKANNILGNNKSGKQRILNSGNVFKTRIGICGDFADLFVQMARMADLKAKRINGYAGENITRNRTKSTRHAWNAVRIDKKWYLLDATWAMQGDYTIFDDMEKVRDYKRAVRERRRHTEELTVAPQRTLNEKWFLTPAEVMIETHFPDEIKWQLLDKPINPKDIFKTNEKRRSRKTNQIQSVKLQLTK